ncbi:MAG: hypothetical protein A2W64_00165 [Candidatus Zambryskibacteria bacterium RIFCSPLOWO2_02_39_10]|nr:MAG: hypothetical protein A3C63_02195 [Candidatus Zambryskibacteria bacterium RIFCSPHIGHO2_02_FULL_39_82]OHB07551.1 MAG: hypothetical protein A2W64_00165 [Candidatus Zambryskibacteria bacterium RIFCSPLOWO2_02_39_10]
MNTIILSKSEYEILKAQSSAYERLLSAITAQSIVTPPTKSKSKTLSAFRNTGKYNKNFLVSFKKGLHRSSFFTDK